MKITNLWKKLFILIGVLFLLASCIPTPPESSEEEVIQQEDNEEGETSIVPTYQLSEEQYKPIIPFRPSAARSEERRVGKECRRRMAKKNLIKRRIKKERRGSGS